MKPSRLILKGSRPNPKAAPTNSSLWILEASDQNVFDMETQVDELLGQLRNFLKLRKLDSAFEAYISAVVHFVGDDSRPTIGLSTKQLKRLAEMECALDVDYYLIANGSRDRE